MNKHLAKDLERYADMLAEGELVSPDDLNCSAVMRLAAEALAQPEQELVAWLTDRDTMYFDKEDARRDCDGFIFPLFKEKNT